MYYTHCSILSLKLSSGFHPQPPPLSVFSALFLILPSSRFIVPDFPLLVTMPFSSSSAPRHGTILPFLSDRNSVWTPSNQTSRHFFSQNNRPSCHVFHSTLLSPSTSSLSLLSRSAKIKCCIVSICVMCVCLCVCVYALGIVSIDKVLHFINTLIIFIIKQH